MLSEHIRSVPNHTFRELESVTRILDTCGSTVCYVRPTEPGTHRGVTISESPSSMPVFGTSLVFVMFVVLFERWVTTRVFVVFVVFENAVKNIVCIRARVWNSLTEFECVRARVWYSLILLLLVIFAFEVKEFDREARVVQMTFCDINNSVNETVEQTCVNHHICVCVAGQFIAEFSVNLSIVVFEVQNTSCV